MKRNWMFIMATFAAGSMAIAGTNMEDDEGVKTAPGPAYSVSKGNSVLYWEGSKPGGSHHGTIDIINGRAETKGNRITGGSFDIDMNSIRNEDLDNENMQEKLVGHLKSEDFFYTEKYPLSSFVITSVESIKGSSHLITGDLTIRGNTHEINFPAEISMDEQGFRAQTGEIILDRTRWEVNHMSKSVYAEIKDRFIDDEMLVKLDIQFSQE